MKKIKELFYKHRVVVLFLAFVVGFAIVKIIFTFCLSSFIPGFDRIEGNLFLAILSLPVIFCLWLFRTKDRKENTQTNALFNALKMLSETTNVQSRSIGLQALIYLKNVEKVFEKQINFYTHNIHLEEANLEGAHLEGAHLEGAHLQGADLQGAHLERARLQEAHLEEAHLQGAHLQEADLWGAHLEGAHLEAAKLQRATLRSADLEEAHLQGADLEGAHLEAAKLQKAKLQEAHLEGAHLKGAYYSKQTDFPDSFKPEDNGMQLVQE